MKRLLVLLMVCLLCVQGFTQSTRKIRELEKQHAELQKQISASETLLQSTKKDVKSQLDNLALLSGQINERKKYIETIEQDVKYNLYILLDCFNIFLAFINLPRQ